MNRLIRLNKATVISLIVALIACFGPLQNARGQNPCPTNCINNNTAIGGALQAITTGRFNTGTGYVALNYNTTGNRNTATGYAALLSNTTASDNTANGAYALNKNTVGANNTAIGTGALLNNTTGNYNVASGFMALRENATGEFNTATGAGALLNNTADENTATGAAALFSNTTGGFNTAAGSATLYRNTTGAHNTANGFQTLSNNTTGSDNVALGFLAGNNQTTGSNNVYIGSNILGVAGENNACYIGSIFGQTSVNGIPVLISSNNKLGTATSSARFKRDIHDMNKTSEALFALRPVAFRYKEEIDPAGTSQLGLVAEDVAKVNPDLVVRDKEGKPYSVRYDQVNAMLLNEFLKEHRKVEQLTKDFESKLEEQQKQIEALTAGLQKVSAQVEMSRPAPQMVVNDQ
jgi:trimeric autotransporter adhesin